MKKNPKVSILCLTYNQKLFITQALDSFLMQKTDFDFEILIHDDASTDGTTKIIRQYQKKYPSIIKIIVQKENQFSKGNSEILTEYLFPLVKGKYIALCEGDDFFTDESKLQTQAEFLDNNPKCSLCFHPTRVIFENYQNDEYLFPDVKKSKDFSLAALIKENFIQTNSVMYRKQKYTDLPKNKILPGDWYLHMYHAQFGKIGYIDKVMSVYRRHPGGIWWEAYKNPDALIEKVGIEYLTMHVETMALFGKNPEYREIIINNFTKLLNYYVAVSKKTITESFKKVLA